MVHEGRSASVGEAQQIAYEFDRDGYAVIRNVLPPSEIDILLRRCDELWSEHTNLERPNSKVELHGDVLCAHRAFVGLASLTRVLGPSTLLLGWNIQVGYLGLVMNPPQAPTKLGLDWHQDGGRVNFDLTKSPRPRLSVKAAFWLTDGSSEGCGTFYALPASQLQGQITRNPVSDPEGATPVLVNAGDVILFDRRVWHARKANRSVQRRCVVFVDYSMRWMEPKCSLPLAPHVRDGLTPTEEQLFDVHKTTWRAYAPRGSDSPLEGWMARHGLVQGRAAS